MSEIKKEKCDKCGTLTDEYLTMYGEMTSGGWAEVRCKACLIDFLQQDDGYYLDTLYSISYSKDVFKEKE